MASCGVVRSTALACKVGDLPTTCNEWCWLIRFETMPRDVGIAPWWSMSFVGDQMVLNCKINYVVMKFT